jgi:hypothetical protein
MAGRRTETLFCVGIDVSLDGGRKFFRRKYMERYHDQKPGCDLRTVIACSFLSTPGLEKPENHDADEYVKTRLVALSYCYTLDLDYVMDHLSGNKDEGR